MPRKYSTWPWSSCRVRSPIHRKWVPTLYHTGVDAAAVAVLPPREGDPGAEVAREAGLEPPGVPEATATPPAAAVALAVTATPPFMAGPAESPSVAAPAVGRATTPSPCCGWAPAAGGWTGGIAVAAVAAAAAAAVAAAAVAAPAPPPLVRERLRPAGGGRGVACGAMQCAWCATAGTRCELTHPRHISGRPRLNGTGGRPHSTAPRARTHPWRPASLRAA